MTPPLPAACYLPESAVDGAERFTATELTRGPWDVAAQHGGPPSALLARSIERFQNDDGGMLVTRVTVELLRPIPLATLGVRTRMERPGKRVQLVVASLYAGDTEVARATGLRMRRAQLDLPELLPHGLTPPPSRETGISSEPKRDMIHFGSHAVEHRFVQGSFDQPGRASDWIRLTQPLVAGEPTSALCRVVAAADFGNGVSALLPFDGSFLYINADLGVYLHREPVGEWFCLEAQSHYSPLGVGLAESRLWDERGPLGRSLQSLLVDRGR